MKRPFGHPFHSNSGFTFVELIIAMALAALILAAFTSVFYQSVTTIQANNNRVTAVRNLDTAGDWFIRDLQPAQTMPGSAILRPNSGNITVIQSINSTSDNSVAYSINSSNDFVRTVAGKSSRIAQHITSLVYTPGTGSTPNTANMTAAVGNITLSKMYSTATRITDATTILTILTHSLAGCDVGIAYDETLMAYGGTSPYTWSVASGSLPAWATLNASSGEITGTPTLGTSSFTIKVTDSVGGSATSQSLSITIVAKPTGITYSPSSLPAANIGQSYGPVNFSVTPSGSGASPLLWSITDPTNAPPPDGLTLGSTTGILSGVPAADAVTSTFQVTVTDGAGVAVTSGSLTITVNAPLTVVTNAASGIGQTTATLNGNLTSVGGASSAAVSFQYGTSVSYGSTATGVPASLSAPGAFTASLTGLTTGTTYHYRAVATASGSTVYGSDQTFVPTSPNPTPTTTSISPTSKNVGDAQFTLTMNGTNFITSSIVRFNGSARATTYVNATQLTATIPASDLTTGGTFNITVYNPAPGGGTSNAQTFTVNNPVPSITGLSPNPGSKHQAFTLTVTGANFVSGSVVNLSGTAQPTTYVSATQLTVTVPYSNPGTISVTVTNPTPGGGTSNTMNLTISP